MTVKQDNVSNPYGDENQVQSGWMKFDTPGNAIKWTIVDIFTKEGNDWYPAQKVFVLDKATLDQVKVTLEGNWAEAKATISGIISSEPTGKTNTPIKTTSEYLMRMTREFKPWDIVWFAFTHEIPTKKNPAKSIKVFKIWVDQEWLSQNNNSYKESNSVSDEISVEDIPFNK